MSVFKTYLNFKDKSLALDLIRKGHSANDTHKGDRFLHWLLSTTDQKAAEPFIEAAIATGADLGTPDKMGNTLLHLARTAAIARMLISHGGPECCERRSNAGLTPLAAMLHRTGTHLTSDAIAATLVLLEHASVDSIKQSRALEVAVGNFAFDEKNLHRTALCEDLLEALVSHADATAVLSPPVGSSPFAAMMPLLIQSLCRPFGASRLLEICGRWVERGAVDQHEPSAFTVYHLIHAWRSGDTEAFRWRLATLNEAAAEDLLSRICGVPCKVPSALAEMIQLLSAKCLNGSRVIPMAIRCTIHAKPPKTDSLRSLLAMHPQAVLVANDYLAECLKVGAIRCAHLLLDYRCQHWVRGAPACYASVVGRVIREEIEDDDGDDAHDAIYAAIQPLIALLECAVQMSTFPFPALADFSQCPAICRVLLSNGHSTGDAAKVFANAMGSDYINVSQLANALRCALDCGMDIHWATPKGATLLMLAATHRCLPICRLLIENGLCPSDTDPEGFTAFDYLADGMCTRDFVRHKRLVLLLEPAFDFDEESD